MENVSKIFGSVLETNENDLRSILSCLEEHQTFYEVTETLEIEANYSKIGTLLNNVKSRDKGLIILSNIISQCPLQILEDKLQNYFNVCIKIISSKEGIEKAQLQAFNILELLLMKSKDASELHKVAVSNIPKILEHVSKMKSISPSNRSALKFLNTCMKYYPGPSGSMKNKVEEYLNSFVDSEDPTLVEEAGICLHLLQQIRGGGTHGSLHKKTWNEYQTKLIGSIHEILSQIYQHTFEINDVNEDMDRLKLPALNYSDEPLICARQMSCRISNLLIFLETTILEPYPVAKPVQPLKILNMVKRGLSVNCTTLAKNPIMENIALGVFLPQIHEKLYDVLNALIAIVQSNLLPFSNLICEIYDQGLSWTASGRSNGKKRSYGSLRSNIYQSVSIWCETAQNGSSIDEVAESILGNIFQDITPYQSEVTLQVNATGNKKLSHKAKKKLQNAQYKASNMNKMHSSDKSLDNLKYVDIDSGNVGLCKAALDCLSSILDSAGMFIKPVLQSILHEKIIGLCADVGASWNSIPLYKDHESRMALFNVLASMIQNPHHLCPPPLQYATYLLDLTIKYDDNFEVKKKCSELYKIMETIVHPRREVLYFNIGEKRANDAIVDKQKNSLNDYLKSGNNIVYREISSDVVMQIDDVECSDTTTNDEKKRDDGQKEDNVPTNVEIIDVDKEDADGKGNSSIDTSCQIIIDDSEDVELVREDDNSCQEIPNKSDDDVEIIEPPKRIQITSEKEMVQTEEPTTKKIKLTEDNEEVDAKVQDLLSSFVDELNDDEIL